jgi:hypothetical protein
VNTNLNADLLDGLHESAFLLLAGRSGTTNDPILSTTAAGSIYGSTSASFGLNLFANTAAAPRTARIATDMLQVFNANYTYPTGSAGDFQAFRHSPTVSAIDVANPNIGAIDMRPIYQYTITQAYGFGGIKAGLFFNPTWKSSGGLGAGTDTATFAGISCLPSFDGATGPRTWNNLYGVFAQPRSVAGTVTSLAGVLAQPASDAAGTVGTARGVYVQDANLLGTIATGTVGIDLEITKGTANSNRTSLRSTDTGANLRHVGAAVFGANAAPTNASVGVEIQSTTRAFLLPRMTTTQRNALTAVDGMMVYNTTTATSQHRQAGAWVNV